MIDTLAAGLLVAAVLALLVQAILLMLARNSAERSTIVRGLRPLQALAVWVGAAAVLLLVRGLVGTGGFGSTLSQTDTWASAVGTGFALSGGALVVTRWWHRWRSDAPAWRPGLAAIVAGIAAVLVAVSSLPL